MFVWGFFFLVLFFFVDINIIIRLKELRNRDRNIFCSPLFHRDYSYFVTLVSSLGHSWHWGHIIYHTELPSSVSAVSQHIEVYGMLQISLGWFWFPEIIHIQKENSHFCLATHRISTLGNNFHTYEWKLGQTTWNFSIYKSSTLDYGTDNNGNY